LFRTIQSLKVAAIALGLLALPACQAGNTQSASGTPKSSPPSAAPVTRATKSAPASYSCGPTIAVSKLQDASQRPIESAGEVDDRDATTAWCLYKTRKGLKDPDLVIIVAPKSSKTATDSLADLESKAPGRLAPIDGLGNQAAILDHTEAFGDWGVWIVTDAAVIELDKIDSETSDELSRNEMLAIARMAYKAVTG